MPRVEVTGRSARIQPLWARVDANRTKLSVFVVLFVFGSAVLLTAALVATPGALIALVAQDSVPAYWRLYGWVVGGSLVALLGIGSLVAAVQLANAQDWVCNRFLGRPLADHEAPELASVVADMTLAAGLAEPPNLLVLDIDSHNAFAIGTARRRATIGVTRGMLSDYSLDELRAVVATLVARIVAGDIMFGTALAALMGPIRAVRESRKATGGAAAGCADAGCGDPGCSNAGCNGCSDLGDGCGDLGGDDGCGWDARFRAGVKSGTLEVTTRAHRPGHTREGRPRAIPVRLHTAHHRADGSRPARGICSLQRGCPT